MAQSDCRSRLLCSILDDSPAAAESLSSVLLGEQLSDEEFIELAILCRDRNRNPIALQFLDAITKRSPRNVVALFEAAFIHRLEGRHLTAARLLLRAHSAAPLDMRIATASMHMLHAAKAHDDADDLYRKLVACAGDWAPATQAVYEFGKYVRTWSPGAAMLLLDRVQEAYGYLHVEDIAQRIISALDGKQPFALIRLGDGEGGCVNFGEDEETEFKALYAQNRGELIGMWFGHEFDANGVGFMSVGRKIIEAALIADVVGVPYESWLSHEYKIASLRGIPSLVNVLRAFDRMSGMLVKKPALCTQQIHMELYNTGLLGKILQRAENAAVVTCLSEIPNLLESHFGIRNVELYRIPGEKGSAAALGADAVAGSHFPGAFNEMLNRLMQPHNGRLFLIAGGILGKFYATTIRQFGGIALDVGSVVDAMAKKPTRPGIAI